MPLELQRRKPKRFKGSKHALVEFIGALRARDPNITIVANGGLPVVESHGPLFDGLMTESIFGGYSWNDGRYVSALPDTQRAERIQRLQRVRQSNGFPIFALEYIPSTNVALTAEACRTLLDEGFLPYLGPIDLQILGADRCDGD